MNEKNLIWNPFRENYFENPHEYLRVWRERNPVHKGVNNSWIALKYEDVKFLLTNPIFKTWKTHEAVLSANQYLDKTENFNDLSNVFNSVLLFLDPPKHMELRAVITKIWNAIPTDELIREAVEESLESLVENDEIEIVSAYARAVPTRLISKNLGLPADDYARITDWSHQFIVALEPFVSLPQLREYNRHARAFYEYMTLVIEEKQREPDEFFISRLLTANEFFDERLSRDEIISVLCMLFFAGIETSVNLLSQSVLLLIKNPEQVAFARETEELSAAAANELIRYVSPVSYTKRVAAEDVEIRGVEIKAGESLLAAIISANYDADVFADPERLDLSRVKNPHLGFGSGAHFCLGAKLGREQISRSLPALFRRFPNINLNAERQPQWDKLIMNRSLSSMFVNLNS